MKGTLFAGVVSFYAFCGLQLQAANIAGLFNTGVDDGGVALVDNAIDSHWSVTPEGAETASPIVVSSAGGFPVGPWLGDSAESSWISVSEDTNGDPIDHAFRQGFNLLGLDPSTVLISGRWSSDNSGVDILVNGASTGFTNDAQFGDWTDFSLSSADGHAFQAGDNELTFVVNNAPPNLNPVGLRVEFSSATADVIPEPSAAALCALGVVFVFRRRR